MGAEGTCFPLYCMTVQKVKPFEAASHYKMPVFRLG